MILYRALSAENRRSPVGDRETVDRWASEQIKAGSSGVWVYAKTPRAKRFGSELVGRWEGKHRSEASRR